jgi:hypothetical protein
MEAAEAGDCDMIKLLNALGANLYTKDNNENSA